MAADGLSDWVGIDFDAPWMVPWAPWVRPLVQQVMAGDSVSKALNRARQALGPAAPDIEFVPQTELPLGQAYEAYIARTRSVPTRDNLHDLLNGACWLRFPAIKSRLNQLQAEQIARMGVGSRRGPVRDALTLLDENALLLCGPSALREAHLLHDWSTMFVRKRGLWAQTHVVAFGHALLEKLRKPYKSITAHVLWLDLPEWCEGGDATAVDRGFEQVLPGQLSADWLATKPFLPLPVLGLPGWCADNEQPGFYDDVGVFRPKIQLI